MSTKCKYCGEPTFPSEDDENICVDCLTLQSMGEQLENVFPDEDAGVHFYHEGTELTVVENEYFDYE